MHHTFNQLTTDLGLRTATIRPRVHDLRHSFAVRTLIDWHRAGLDIDSRMSVLSTYLGHVNPAGTYWYLSAVTGADGPGRGNGWTPIGGTAMSELAPTLQAFFTERLMGQRRASPTPSPATGTPSGCCCASPPTAPAPKPASWTSPTWTPR